MNLQFKFLAKLWQVSSKGGWFFVSLPKEVSEEIRANFKKFQEGWGRLKVKAEVENEQWETAIWYDRKAITYLLPIKLEIRKKYKLVSEQIIQIILYV